MGLGLLLLPALGGYWLLTHLHYTRYQAVRYSGYHILFRSAIVGAGLLAIAQALVLTINHYLPSVAAQWEPLVPVQYFDSAVLSFVLGLLLPALGNRFIDADKAVRQAARKSGDIIELLIAESMERGNLIELSLRGGKSYIGIALVSGIEKHIDSDVSLVPLFSGYRDKATQELIITTEYASVIRESLAGNPPIPFQDFQVVIPMSEIVSARTFIPEAYERFRAAAGEPPYGAGGAGGDESGAGKPE